MTPFATKRDSTTTVSSNFWDFYTYFGGSTSIEQNLVIHLFYLGKLQNLRPWGTRDHRLWRWKFRLGAPSAGGIEYKVCPLSKVKHSRCPPDRDRANDLYVISPSASVFINISQLMILISQQGLNDWFSIWHYHLLFIYYSRLHNVSDLLIHSSTTRMTGLQTRTCLEFGRPVWHQHLSLCVPWGPVCQ